MTSLLIRRGILVVSIFLALSYYSCTSAGDYPLNKQAGTTPAKIISGEQHSKVHFVEISGMKFHPDHLNVHAGDTIVWTNKDITTHCVTEEHIKAWTSLNILKDSSWKMVVNKSSDYYCAIHQVMKGKITVD